MKRALVLVVVGVACLTGALFLRQYWAQRNAQPKAVDALVYTLACEDSGNYSLSTEDPAYTGFKTAVGNLRRLYTANTDAQFEEAVRKVYSARSYDVGITLRDAVVMLIDACPKPSGEKPVDLGFDRKLLKSGAYANMAQEPAGPKAPDVVAAANDVYARVYDQYRTANREAVRAGGDAVDK